jgi:hypothetical protein
LLDNLLSNGSNVGFKLLDFGIKALLCLFLELVDLLLEVSLDPLASVSRFPLSVKSSAYSESAAFKMGKMVSWVYVFVRILYGTLTTENTYVV